MKNPVFILGLFDTGYYAARLLKNDGITIFGFDSNPINPGFYSNIIKPFEAPNPLTNPDDLLKTLIIKRNEFSLQPVLIATSETYLTFIYNYRNSLEKYFLFILPQQEILGKILNKAEQFKLAQRLSIEVPKYEIISDINNLNAIIEKLKHPLIIKSYNQAIWKSLIDKKAYISKSISESINIIIKLFQKIGPVIIQELIEGDVLNNYEYNALMFDGRIIEYNVIQKLYQYPIDFGAACCVKNIINTNIEKLGSKFILDNKIEGFSNTEFKYDPSNGIYYFIETNSRVWLQIEMTKKLGQNYVRSYYDFLVGEKTPVHNYAKFNEKIWLDLPSFMLLVLRYRKKLNLNIFNVIKLLFKTTNYGLISFSDLNPFMKTVILKSRKPDVA